MDPRTTLHDTMTDPTAKIPS